MQIREHQKKKNKFISIHYGKIVLILLSYVSPFLGSHPSAVALLQTLRNHGIYQGLLSCGAQYTL